MQEIECFQLIKQLFFKSDDIRCLIMINTFKFTSLVLLRYENVDVIACKRCIFHEEFVYKLRIISIFWCLCNIPFNFMMESIGCTKCNRYKIKMVTTKIYAICVHRCGWRLYFEQVSVETNWWLYDRYTNYMLVR